MNKVQRRELVEDIVAQVQTTADIEQQAYITTFVQKRPYTFVEIAYYTSKTNRVIGWGFAKVNWSDEWSPEYGKQLATRKAAAHIVKQLNGNGCECGCECGCKDVVYVSDITPIMASLPASAK